MCMYIIVARQLFALHLCHGLNQEHQKTETDMVKDGLNQKINLQVFS